MEKRGRGAGKSFDREWLPSGNVAIMPVMQTIHETDKVRVAAIFEPGQMRPVWFDAGKGQVRITELCAQWFHSSGSSRVINFDVGDGVNRYCLSFDIGSLAWSLGKTVIE
jgi:hypothetical protein